MIQADLDTTGYAGKVQILGINPAGLESGNQAITAGRRLPWLQETAEDDVWGDWEVTYRDVVILDAENVPVGVYNLTEHNLAEAQNRADLARMLREAAAP